MIITKCGNGYTNEEWAEMMKNWDTEIAQVNDYIDATDKIKSIAAKKLIANAAVDEDKAYSIACHIYDVGTSEIQFTSEEKRQAVEEINEWMCAQERAL